MKKNKEIGHLALLKAKYRTLRTLLLVVLATALTASIAVPLVQAKYVGTGDVVFSAALEGVSSGDLEDMLEAATCRAPGTLGPSDPGNPCNCYAATAASVTSLLSRMTTVEGKVTTLEGIVSTIQSTYVKTTDLNTLIANYSTTAQMNTAIATAVSGHVTAYHKDYIVPASGAGGVVDTGVKWGTKPIYQQTYFVTTDVSANGGVLGWYTVVSGVSGITQIIDAKWAGSRNNGTANSPYVATPIVALTGTNLQVLNQPGYTMQTVGGAWLTIWYTTT